MHRTVISFNTRSVSQKTSDEQQPNANTPVNFSIPDLSTSFLSNLGVFCSALSLTEVSRVRANHDEMSVCRVRFDYLWIVSLTGGSVAAVVGGLLLLFGLSFCLLNDLAA